MLTLQIAESNSYDSLVSIGITMIIVAIVVIFNRHKKQTNAKTNRSKPTLSSNQSLYPMENDNSLYQKPTKRCPYCGEIILAKAKKCKFCGEWIESVTN